MSFSSDAGALHAKKAKEQISNIDPEKQFIQCSGLVVYVVDNRQAEIRMIPQPALKIRSCALTITLLALLSACASLPGPASGDSVERSGTGNPVRQNRGSASSVGEKAAGFALQQVGVPYRYGGATTNGFDCSGLIQFSYQAAGKSLPRTTGQLWSATRTIDRKDVQKGDLLFFSIEGKMSHVGMYLGGERFVHAPSSGRSVSVAKLNSPFYAKAFLRAGRPK